MTREEMIQNGIASMFGNQNVVEAKPVNFMAFAKERNFTGKWNALKDPLYTKTHQQGDMAGQKACYIKRVSKKTGKSYWSKIDVKPEELN